MSEPECTHHCHSGQHGRQVVNAVTSRVTTDHLKTYLRHVCHNFPHISDHLGRTVLHMAASCGHSELIQWLVDKCRADVELWDFESGWTALHRSIFYGQISAVKTLLTLGASLQVKDRNHMTPLDLLVMDRPPFMEYRRSDPCDCYVWGSNDNFNLGLESEKTQKFPEMVSALRRKGLSVREVVIKKFHTLFLTSDGQVLTCGHGHGGRLGQGSEDLCLTPEAVSGLPPNNSSVEAMAAGKDHVILLVRHSKDKSLNVYTCGNLPLFTYRSPPFKQAGRFKWTRHFSMSSCK